MKMRYCVLISLVWGILWPVFMYLIDPNILGDFVLWGLEISGMLIPWILIDVKSKTTTEKQLGVQEGKQ